MDRELRAAGLLVAVATLAAGAGPGGSLPRALAEPSTVSTTSASPAAKPSFPSDDRGYLDSAARCDDGQTLMLFGRTSRSLVAVCVGPDGQLEYRGVRLSDHSSLTLAASRNPDGALVATNDDVTYTITPQVLLVSENDTVLYRDPWLEYHKAGFPAGATSTSAAAAPATTSAAAAPATTSAAAAPATTSAAAATTTTSSPTVSTTTVTLPPTG